MLHLRSLRRLEEAAAGRRDGERMGGTELRKGGKEKGKGSCAEAQVLCLVAADKSAREDRNWAAVCHTTAARRGREEETWHGNCPHTPSSAVLSKIGAQGGAPFLVGRLKTTTTTAAAATATPPPPAERPTDQLPPRPSHRPPGEKVGRKGGGGRETPHRARPTFSILPVSSLFDRCLSLSSRQLFPPAFFSFFLSVSHLCHKTLVSRLESAFVFIFSFLWCRYCFFFLSHDITIIIISVAFFSLSLYFFSLLTGVYRNSALITATSTTTASSHYQDLFFFLSSFSSLCVVYHTNFTPLSRCLLFLFLWGICMKWSVQVEKKRLNKGKVIYGELKGRKKMALHSIEASCFVVKNWG